MSDGLSAEEVRAFATVFADPVPARHVLETAGLPRDRHPSWVDSNAGLFWFEVSGLLAAGALVDGRAAVLAVASSLFPGNPVFAAGAAAGPVGTSAGGVALAARVGEGLATLTRKQAQPAPRGPWMAKPQDRVVERPELGERLLAALTAPGAGEVGLTTALAGAGGFGKTTTRLWHI